MCVITNTVVPQIKGLGASINFGVPGFCLRFFSNKRYQIISMGSLFFAFFFFPLQGSKRPEHHRTAINSAMKQHNVVVVT